MIVTSLYTYICPKFKKEIGDACLQAMVFYFDRIFYAIFLLITGGEFDCSSQISNAGSGAIGCNKGGECSAYSNRSYQKVSLIK